MSKAKSYRTTTINLYEADHERLKRLKEAHKGSASEIVRTALKVLEGMDEEGVCKPPSASPSPSDASTAAKRSWTVGMDLWRD